MNIIPLEAGASPIQADDTFQNITMIQISTT